MYSICALKAHHCRFSSSRPFSPSSSLSDSFPTANSLSPGIPCAMVKAGRYVWTALRTSPTFSSDVNNFAAYMLGICTTQFPYQTTGTHHWCSSFLGLLERAIIFGVQGFWRVLGRCKRTDDIRSAIFAS